MVSLQSGQKRNPTIFNCMSMLLKLAPLNPNRPILMHITWKPKYLAFDYLCRCLHSHVFLGALVFHLSDTLETNSIVSLLHGTVTTRSVANKSPGSSSLMTQETTQLMPTHTHRLCAICKSRCPPQGMVYLMVEAIYNESVVT